MQNTRDNYNACTKYLHRWFEVSAEYKSNQHACTKYLPGSFEVEGGGGEVPVQNLIIKNMCTD